MREAGSVDGRLEREDLADVDGVPAAESRSSHPAPEVALQERGSATTQLVVAKATLPEVDHLADARDAVDLRDRPLQQRRAAAAEPADVQDRNPLGRFRRW